MRYTVPSSRRWQMQLESCRRKGALAFEQGKTKSACPYVLLKGKGVNLQRRNAWFKGWDQAADRARKAAAK